MLSYSAYRTAQNLLAWSPPPLQAPASTAHSRSIKLGEQPSLQRRLEFQSLGRVTCHEAHFSSFCKAKSRSATQRACTRRKCYQQRLCQSNYLILFNEDKIWFPKNMEAF
ncbi:hypothetical protein GOP47_0015386 [Adiantum capillus-veneris]|uniref:Uncharacterized protein n=1 Tax=Adiantum capillus-veneris TaxID=13818 RepID=A0A9D4ZD55_ADICA|nr:hypothetical protein GOP47_0015386 [Adiantum capillus-veneris]